MGLDRICVVADSTLSMHHADGSWACNSAHLKDLVNDMAHIWKRIICKTDILKTEGHNKFGANPADAVCNKAMDVQRSYDPEFLFQREQRCALPPSAPRHMSRVCTPDGKGRALTIAEVREFLRTQNANKGDKVVVTWDTAVSRGRSAPQTWHGEIVKYNRPRGKDLPVWTVQYQEELDCTFRLPCVCLGCFDVNDERECCPCDFQLGIRSIELLPKAPDVSWTPRTEGAPSTAGPPRYDTEISNKCQTARWLSKDNWSLWQARCLYVLRNYDPNDEGSEGNA
jgi:hypothetical protein